MTKESATGVERATGRDRPEWFELLDAWGAADRPYRETAAWLREVPGLSAWWAQKLTVESEQARGTRAPGVRRDGTFEVTASKAIGAPVAAVFEALVAGSREAWLPGVSLRERSSTPPGQARFDRGDDGSRVTFTFAATPAGGTTVAVQHQHLPDLEAAEAEKAAWRERLNALKVAVEGAATGLA